MVLVGRIVRPHGNKGNVVVHPETDFAEERFRPGARLFRLHEGSPVETEITGSRPHDGRWVVAFDGITSIDAAETLRDQELRIPAEAMLPAGNGRYYVHDLIGCEVTTAAGEHVGPVARVELATGIPLLVVQGRSGEILIPFAEAICTTVDLQGRRVTIDPPAGLIELNAPGSQRDDH
jgi:16S rRNA processing protein RimM